MDFTTLALLQMILNHIVGVQIRKIKFKINLISKKKIKKIKVTDS
jgi:hypothetical protein